MALYPPLESFIQPGCEPNTQAFCLPKIDEIDVPTVNLSNPQAFRLQKIGELETFLRSELDSRSRLHKKYRRAVNILDGSCASLATTGMAMGIGGAVLLSTGVGLVPGLVLEGATVLAGLLDAAGVVISRRCSAKAAKHEAVRVLAASKLDTVHSHISKALEDCSISDDEYKLILDEVEKYRAMKDEIRRKSPIGSAVVDEETKNELIKRGRELERALTIKKLTTSDSQSS